MKTILIIILIAISVSSVFSQIDSLSFKKDIDELDNKVSSFGGMLDEIQKINEKVQQENILLNKTQLDLKENYKQLLNDFDNYKIKSEERIDSLQNLINANSVNIDKTANELGIKIEKTEESTSQSITDLNQTLSQNTLYWIIAILVVVLIVLLVFILLRKQIFRQKLDLDSSLQATMDVLETQLKIIDNTGSKQNKEVDHTLALKVADEIIRIQKNLTRMDEKTKGLKQLSASVKRIQDNFASNGYELVEMLGKPYNEGMKVSANFIPDEDLGKGEQIISRIIKPQVNYEGVMIQSAQIEVSQGE